MHQYLKWFRSFYAVALRQSFTQAAEYLHIGQPTVSEQVKSLERVFKVELFHRHGNQVVLSQAGQQLFEIIKPMFKLEEEAVSLLHSFQHQKAGLLRLGAVSPPMAMELTYQLKQTYPDIEFQTGFYSATENLRRLSDFDLDVAILSQTEFDPSFYTRLYKDVPIVAVVREDHPWAQQSFIHTYEIEQQTLIAREQGSQTRYQVEAYCQKKGLSYHYAMELNSREAIFHAILQGVGIGFVSEVEFIAMPGLKAIRFLDHPLFISYYLCCLAIRKDRPMIAEIFEQHALPSSWV